MFCGGKPGFLREKSVVSEAPDDIFKLKRGVVKIIKRSGPIPKHLNSNTANALGVDFVAFRFLEIFFFFLFTFLSFITQRAPLITQSPSHGINIIIRSTRWEKRVGLSHLFPQETVSGSTSSSNSGATSLIINLVEEAFPSRGPEV